MSAPIVHAARLSGTTIALSSVAFFLGTGLTICLWLFGGLATDMFGICAGGQGALGDVYFAARWLTPLGGACAAFFVARWHQRRHVLPREPSARRFGRRSPFVRN